MNTSLRSPVFSGGYQCRGTYKLGTACGECDKCKLEFASLSSADVNRAFSAQNDYESLKAMMNTPELTHFDRGIVSESAHQIQNWGAKSDSGKTHPDWFWLVGYLAGKVLSAMMTGDRDKALHHTISTAAALRNWHRHILTGNTSNKTYGTEDITLEDIAETNFPKTPEFR